MARLKPSMCVLFQAHFLCLARGQPSVSAVDCVDVSALIDLWPKTDVSFPRATPWFVLATPWFHQGFFRLCANSSLQVVSIVWCGPNRMTMNSANRQEESLERPSSRTRPGRRRGSAVPPPDPAKRCLGGAHLVDLQNHPLQHCGHLRGRPPSGLLLRIKLSSFSESRI
jgi:hypothetical protein